MLYAEEHVTATRTLGVKLKYACPECGFSSNVFAIGTGRGQARNPFLVDTGADERASDEAFYAANRSAREAVRLVRCPRCGDRNRSAHRSFWLVAFIKLFALALILGLVGALLVLAKHTELGWAVLLVGIPLLLFVSYLFDIRPRIRTAEARVVFEPPQLKHRRRHDPTAAAYFTRTR